MKIIKVQFFILTVISIIIIYFMLINDIFILRLIGMMVIGYWLYLNILIVVFSYYFQRRIMIAGFKGQKELKNKIGLRKHGISFKKYYKSNISEIPPKSNKNNIIICGVKEERQKITNIKMYISIVLFSIIFILLTTYFIHNTVILIFLLLLGTPMVIAFLHITIMLVRYEEGLFVKDDN